MARPSYPSVSLGLPYQVGLIDGGGGQIEVPPLLGDLAGRANPPHLVLLPSPTFKAMNSPHSQDGVAIADSNATSHPNIGSGSQARPSSQDPFGQSGTG